MRFDQGTNFTCARKQMTEDEVSIDDTSIRTVVDDLGLKWIQTPPMFSHSGGVWESKVECIKNVLNGAMKGL